MSAIQLSNRQAKSGGDEEFANFICKGPDCKYFQLYGDIQFLLQLLNCAIVVKKVSIVSE